MMRFYSNTKGYWREYIIDLGRATVTSRTNTGPEIIYGSFDLNDPAVRNSEGYRFFAYTCKRLLQHVSCSRPDLNVNLKFLTCALDAEPIVPEVGQSIGTEIISKASLAKTMVDKVPEDMLFWKGFPAGVSYFPNTMFGYQLGRDQEWITVSLSGMEYLASWHGGINAGITTFDFITGRINWSGTGRTDQAYPPEKNDQAAIDKYRSGIKDLISLLTHGVFGSIPELSNTVQYCEYILSLLDKMTSADPVSPNNIALASAYPNPFSASTTLRLSNSLTSDADVTITNSLGQKVATLRIGAGSQSVNWNGTDENGHRLPSGAYLYFFIANGNVQKGKMVLQ